MRTFRTLAVGILCLAMAGASPVAPPASEPALKLDSRELANKYLRVRCALADWPASVDKDDTMTLEDGDDILRPGFWMRAMPDYTENHSIAAMEVSGEHRRYTMNELSIQKRKLIPASTSMLFDALLSPKLTPASSTMLSLSG